MLVTLKKIMDIAKENAFAIGSFNTPNIESIKAVLGGADTLNLPVIIQFAQCHEELMPLEIIGPVMLECAKRADVPVCVHLDHGETVEYIKTALDIGFTSVMYDGSVLDYEENVQGTKQVAARAAEKHASVEAELGTMGSRESGGKKETTGGGTARGNDTAQEEVTSGETARKIYTDPMQAKSFVKETGIDALACSFGTTHGIYLDEPKLDFGIVEQVRKETNGIPIVMHGGSGVSNDDFRRAIKAGVRKINYFTYMDKAGGEQVKNWLKGKDGTGMPVFFSQMALEAEEAMKKNVMDAMKIFALLED